MRFQMMLSGTAPRPPRRFWLHSPWRSSPLGTRRSLSCSCRWGEQRRDICLRLATVTSDAFFWDTPRSVVARLWSFVGKNGAIERCLSMPCLWLPCRWRGGWDVCVK
ncbi:hypothetical protein BN1723_000167 [Verticillium longisporum]|uniref:Uncharacterized protein n=1 Tax=Verticillium longisporum TaxID=100787 RepID=A0A0G4MDH0_VERLO|nr:hypothetical protein BN1723_000167 [Verticillium longisporum]CRK32005.1 hypothetical protein BN1708_005642 [Verticillium longisporum]